MSEQPTTEVTMIYTIALFHSDGGLNMYVKADSLKEIRGIVRRHFDNPMTRADRWTSDDPDLAVVFEGKNPSFRDDLPMFGFVPGPRGGIRRRDW